MWIACVVVGIAATAEGAAVTLAWDPNTGPDIGGYRVSYGTTSGQYTTSVDVGNTTSYTFTNLLAGSTYYFVLQAYNSAGNSPYSIEVSATLISPLTVTNLTANRTSPQPAGTTTTFSATASGGTPPYQYKWWIVTGTTQTVGRNWSTSNSFAWTPTSANPNYTIRVWARHVSSTADAPDNPAATLEMSFAITSRGDTTPPTAATNLTATPTGTQIALSWTAATDNVGVTGYRIERCAGAGCSSFAQIATTTGATAYTNTGLTAGTSYAYRVRATDAATLLGPYSNIATATTPPAVDTMPPTAPGRLTATPSGTQIALSWTAATDNVGVTGYRIERCQGAGCSSFAEIATTTGATTYTNTGLASATSYSYRVRARDAATLLGPYSNTASATTPTAPGGPTGLIAGYSFNAGSGTTAVDSSRNGITGTLVGATWTAAGRYGNALSFNGASAYVDLGNPAALQSTGSTTWAAWVFATGVPADDGQIIAKSNDSSGWQLKTSPDTGPHTFAIAIAASSGGHVQRYSTTVRALNTWYHVAGVYNATARTLDIYVNGVLDNGLMGGTVLVPAAQVVPNINVNIGRRSNGYYFQGVIDDVRVYNRALTPAEISQITNDPGIGPNQPSAATTTASFSAAGTYVLRLTPSDGALSAADELTVTVATAANVAPTVNSGADRSITLPSSTTLTATVSDDGQPTPPGALTLNWTRVSGSGTVTFSAPNAATTNASFSAAGTYVLRLTASDGALSTSDEVTVTVNSGSTSVPGLVAHYRLDDGAGTIASDATGAYPATLVNGAAWVTGRHAGGVSFDGANDYIALPNVKASGAGLTISTWVRTSSFTSSVAQRFVSKATGTADQAHDWMLGLTGNRLRFRLKTNGVTKTLVGRSGNLPLNTWYHATATYDGTRMRLYLNGVEVGSTAKTGAVAMNGNVPLNLGRNPDGSNYMRGTLDDVRIYNRALTRNEILALMNNPRREASISGSVQDRADDLTETTTEIPPTRLVRGTNKGSSKGEARIGQ